MRLREEKNGVKDSQQRQSPKKDVRSPKSSRRLRKPDRGDRLYMSEGRPGGGGLWERKGSPVLVGRDTPVEVACMCN